MRRPWSRLSCQGFARHAEGRAPHDRLGTPWLNPGISPFGHWAWANRLGGSCSARPSKTRAFACPQHIFTDAQSASLRNTGSSPISGFSPLGEWCLFGHPSEGRAPHDRQGTGFGMQPIQLHGRAERVPPQDRVFAYFRVFPVRRMAFVWPSLGGSCSARPQDGIAFTKVLAPLGRRPPLSFGG